MARGGAHEWLRAAAAPRAPLALLTRCLLLPQPKGISLLLLTPVWCFGALLLFIKLTSSLPVPHACSYGVIPDKLRMSSLVHATQHGQVTLFGATPPLNLRSHTPTWW